MYEVLKTILVDDLQVRAEDITPASRCIDVGLDSLTMVELASLASSRLGTPIHDYELRELATVGDIARLMGERSIATGSEPAIPHPEARPTEHLWSSMPGPRLRTVLDRLVTYQPSEGVFGATRLRPMSANESADRPLPSIVAAIAEAGQLAHRYPDPGCTELTQVLAYRHKVSQDQILVGGGSVALLQALFEAVGEPGVQVVYAWRSFELYPVLAELAGVSPIGVPLIDEVHDLDSIADKITSATRLVVICNPNNPTGTVVGGDNLRRFLDQVSPECLVALDEAYFEYVRAPGAVSGLEFHDRYPNLVVLRTFSKAYGLASLRVGYLVGAADIVTQLRKACLAYSVNGIAQQAALAALTLENELLQRVDITVAERERIRNCLLAEGWDVPDSQANFLWLRLGDEAAVFGRWCADAGIAVRTFTGEGVRVSIGSAQDNDAFLSTANEWRTRA